MRILLISPLPPPMGGMAIWTLRYTSYAHKLNWSVDTVNTSIIGTRAKNINAKRNLYNEIIRTLRITFDLKKKLRDRCAQIDVIHINSPCTGFGILRDALLVIMCKKSRLPIVFECHSNIEHMIGNSPLSKKAFCSILRESDLIIVLNEFSRQYAISCMPQKQDKIVILPNFIDEDLISDSHSINSQINKAIYVGHVTKEKGVYELFQTAEVFDSITFDLLGKVDDSVDLSSKPLNVNLLGEVSASEVIKAMDHADLLFFPTHSEGFSLVVLESMARGLPIITTNVGANMDMLEGQGGIIVVPQNVSELVEAINKIKSSETRWKMSLWNMEKVKQTYTSKVIFERLSQLYTDLMTDGNETHEQHYI